MDLPTHSAPVFVLASTRPWTENPVHCQGRIFSAHSMVWRKDFKVQVWSRAEIRVSGMKVEEVFRAVETQEGTKASERHFVPRVAEKPVRARNNDCACPASGFDAEKAEFKGEEFLVFCSQVNIGIDSSDERFGNFLAPRVIPVELFLEIASEFKEAGSDIMAKSFSAEDFSQSPCRPAPPYFKLEETIARRIKTLGKEIEEFAPLRTHLGR